MNIMRRIVVGFGGVIVVALAIELAAPKAVHAIVSTLVTVANTSANPVPVTEGKDLVQEPFATSICEDSGDSYCATTVSTAFGFSSPLQASFTVPVTDASGNAVKALVITFVSGACQGTPALTTSVPTNTTNGIAKAINFLETGTATVIDHTTTIVAGPGSTVAILDSLSPGSGCFLTVNGYLAH